MDITPATAELVFSIAAARGSWKRTNLGATAEVTYGSYTWTVLVPAASGSDPVKARIVGRDGFGGSEFLDVEATWGQTMDVTDAAMSALRTVPDAA
jgi:hypothetical protein